MDQKMEKNKNKTGLVLEGGGMRGIYTAGVLDVFLDEGQLCSHDKGHLGAVHGVVAAIQQGSLQTAHSGIRFLNTAEITYTTQPTRKSF